MAEETIVEGGAASAFVKHGRGYQEKVVQALFQDHSWAEQMSDVLSSGMFDVVYLRVVVEKLFDHYRSYKLFPSMALMESIVRDDSSVKEAVQGQVREYLRRASANPLNGDICWVKDSSLEFCRRQCLVDAIQKSVDMIETARYDSIQGLIKEALSKGSPKDVGHEYMTDMARRMQKSVRTPIPTGWGPIDRELNGGWERGTLTTFIAPTGAGKSMFLVNVSCAALAAGLNVLYCTLEMADWKIGMRADSYFAGVPINDVPDNEERVQKAIAEHVKGRFFIKEWPTKRASTDTIRAHLQHLSATKDFTPDVLVVDYADLLRGVKSYGEKRHELEGIYEELRGLAMEFSMVVVTADQTNRSGLEEEIVSISQIGESYAKATICDVIFTISRTLEDKLNHGGRLLVAKNRLGRDGVLFNFLLNTATVKVRVLEQNQDPVTMALEDPEKMKQTIAERFRRNTQPEKR